MTTQIEMTELEELEQAYCEFYKDVYGIKARWYRAISVEQARKDLDALQLAGEAVWAEERAHQAQCAAKVEKRIVQLVEMGAQDRETAIRWMHDAEQTGGDDQYLCYTLGLEYGYFKR